MKIWGSKSQLEKAAAEFEKKFGVKVEIEEVSLKDNELKQFMLSKVAAKQTADISMLDVFNYLPYNGKIYYLPLGSVVYGLWYNVNLAKQYGIYDRLPKSFDDSNYKDWTWDKYAELLKKATVDTDKDGKTDIYGTIKLHSERPPLN